MPTLCQAELVVSPYKQPAWRRWVILYRGADPGLRSSLEWKVPRSSPLQALLYLWFPTGPPYSHGPIPAPILQAFPLICTHRSNRKITSELEFQAS